MNDLLYVLPSQSILGEVISFIQISQLQSQLTLTHNQLIDAKRQLTSANNSHILQLNGENSKLAFLNCIISHITLINY